MSLFRTNLQPSNRDLRVFGYGLVLLCAVSCVLLYREDQKFAASECALIAILAGIISWRVPRWLHPPYWLMTCVFFPLGWLLSYLILAIVFFAVFTPIGLGMRLFGRDPMQRRIDRQATTYWTPHKSKASLDDYFRQF